MIISLCCSECTQSIMFQSMNDGRQPNIPTVSETLFNDLMKIKPGDMLVMKVSDQVKSRRVQDGAKLYSHPSFVDKTKWTEVMDDFQAMHGVPMSKTLPFGARALVISIKDDHVSVPGFGIYVLVNDMMGWVSVIDVDHVEFQ